MLFVVHYFDINRIENSDREALITSLVTIFVFGTGLFAQVIGNKLKQLEKDKQLKRIFIANLNTVKEGLKLQIDNFNQIINKLRSPDPLAVRFSSFAELDYFEVNQIASEDLYRIFIDYQKGDENDKIVMLENLRKELRFIENSKETMLSGFDKLYTSIREYSENVISGTIELGIFFDKELTRLLHSKKNIEEDEWFIAFSDLWRETSSALKISEDTFTNYEKLEKEIFPKFIEFSRNNMNDPRTPMITSCFSKADNAIYQRKHTIRNLVENVGFYLSKYEEAKNIIEDSIDIYNK